VEGPVPTVRSLTTLVPFVIIIGGFYLVALRPARARQRAAQQMQSELQPGQQVMTGSGLFATVSSVEDDAVVLEVSPGVTLRWARQAISRVGPPDGPAADTEESEAGTTDRSATVDLDSAGRGEDEARRGD
jgi:preprotein translocase subunit YajC